ncbi:MAG TPA: bifunctional phosphopantothenoylcysteine decarboxylase/phosphopantothenate--cysteine ligase CoaBC, partial [Gammaproteobacteria bacterium]|nr:bifunctional phosphopantothenoylcysteine decarboxylase/phosphopantothenate--cysteine ligase CoaBC [Gammaproteobacteria bacterium]
VLVSAGPTREQVDPVRYLSNRSSGKMGYAIATAASEAGARVTLISGPTSLPTPDRIERIDVVSAAEMQQAVLAHAAQCDIFIAAAAVADYGIKEQAPHKIKKDAKHLTLELTRNPDILSSVAALPCPPFTVGFAAETENLPDHARAKRSSKAVDMIAANWVNQPGRGFESDENALQVFWEGGEQDLPLAPKQKLARELVKIIAQRYHSRA